MNILAIETATEELSLSLAIGLILPRPASLIETATEKRTISISPPEKSLSEDSAEIFTLRGTGKMHHLKELIPLTEKILEEKRLTLDDLDYIAIDVGPGSFTGLRIGVTTARTLSQVKNIPLIPVPSLKAFVFLPEKTEEKIIVPILDARANQIYGGAFCLENNEVKTLIETNIFEKDDFLNRIKSIKGEAELKFYADAGKIFPDLLPSFNIYQDSECVLKLAAYMICDGFKEVPYEEIKPLYYRLSEAERRLAEN